MAQPVSWCDGGVLMQAGRDVSPLFPVRTVANSRLSRQIAARSPDEFERSLGAVAWFSMLGQPSPWDEGCVRIYAWDQWRCDAVAEALAFTAQAIYDRIFAASPIGANAVKALFDRTHEIVMDHAHAAVPFDQDADYHHAPSQCVWQAAYDAGLIACALASGWPVPDDLVEVWNWFEAGHWPASFTHEPGDNPHMNGEDITYPRRLVVY